MKTESSHHDHHYTITTGGAWYAPTGRNESPEYLGIEVSGYRVTKKLKSPNHTARWEVTCLKCGAKKETDSTLIKRGIEGSTHDKYLRACKCPGADAEIPLRHAAVVEHYGISATELRVVIAVLAFERVRGESPTRLEALSVLKSRPSIAQLVKKGWLTSTKTVPMRLSATAKARRELGVQP